MGKSEKGNNVIKKEIQQNLGIIDGIVLVTGSMVGAGIFMAPDTIGKLLKGQKVIILLFWFFGGLLAMLGAFSYAELGVLFPKNGGEGVYLSEAYHPFIGRVYNYVVIFFVWPSITSLLLNRAVNCFLYGVLKHKTTFPGLYVVKLAIQLIIISFVFTLNAFQPSQAKMVAKFSVISKFFSVAFLIFIGIICLLMGKKEIHQTTTKPPSGNFRDLIFLYSAVLLHGMWGYAGWNMLNYVAGRISNPRKTFISVIGISIPLVIILYLVLNCIYLYTVPRTLLLDGKGKFLASSLLSLLLPELICTWIFSFIVGIGLLSSVNGCFLAGSFSAQGAAMDGHLPKSLGKNNQKDVPAISMLIIFVLVGVYSFIGEDSIAFLFPIVNIVLLLFFGLCALGVIILRMKKVKYVSPFRVWLPIPIIFGVFSIFIAFIGILSFTQFEMKENPFC